MADQIKTIGRSQAEKIWAILVAECSWRADPRDREAFCHYLAEERSFPHEWRFMGALGFGGKFYNDGVSWRVGCYREDDTPERLRMIGAANARLAELRARDG